MQQPRMNRNLGALVLLPTLLVLSVGCNKPADSDAAATAPSSQAGVGAAAKASPVQQIQSNPHIPDQAKAAIVAHMQGPHPAK